MKYKRSRTRTNTTASGATDEVTASGATDEVTASGATDELTTQNLPLTMLTTPNPEAMLSPKLILSVGTLNVRTLAKQGKIDLVLNELN